jgi:hypothetical protein
MRRSPDSRSTLRCRRFIALALLIGVAILTACAPDAPTRQSSRPEPQPITFSEQEQTQSPEPKPEPESKQESSPTSSETHDTTGTRVKSEAEPLVGSSKGKTYHRPSCEWAQKIRPTNLIRFRDLQEATKKGYAPCRTCLPK